MDLQHIVLHSTGEVVPATGVYTVHHTHHRLTADIVLFGGERFPRCAKCVIPVQFGLDMPVKVEYLPVRVHQLPDLDDEQGKAFAGSTGR
jgi:hypothetical protein